MFKIAVCTCTCCLVLSPAIVKYRPENRHLVGGWGGGGGGNTFGTMAANCLSDGLFGTY